MAKKVDISGISSGTKSSSKKTASVVKSSVSAGTSAVSSKTKTIANNTSVAARAKTLQDQIWGNYSGNIVSYSFSNMTQRDMRNSNIYSNIIDDWNVKGPNATERARINAISATDAIEQAEMEANRTGVRSSAGDSSNTNYSSSSNSGGYRRTTSTSSSDGLVKVNEVAATNKVQPKSASANVGREYANLISDANLIQVPFIKVSIGNYTFGVYQRSTGQYVSGNSIATSKITFPNFVKQLNITKINGQVNQYTLQLNYPVTENSDPNFFEKIFSSVGIGGKIVFSYGDYNAPNNIYKDETAIITGVNTQFPAVGSGQSTSIVYTVRAISDSGVLSAVTYNFNSIVKKPSDVIKSLLRSNIYNLSKMFPGMADADKVETYNLIAGDDKEVQIDARTSISIYDYISYLVSLMVPIEGGTNHYAFNTYDDPDNILGGSYFKIVKIGSDSAGIYNLATYVIDIGYPSNTIVTNFQLSENNNWAIYYKYSQEITSGEYVQRIDDDGNLTNVYAPILISNNGKQLAEADDENWWNNVTQYPVQATLTLRGLLRPAILATYVKLNVYYYGRKHISSGVYIITGENDTISGSGYYTTLSLQRVSADEVV